MADNNDEIVIPDLNPATSFQDSDVVMITHSDGTTEKITKEKFFDDVVKTGIYSDVDLNTILDFGMYRVHCPSENYDTLHFPPIHGWGTLIVARPATYDFNLIQIFQVDHKTVIYMRYIDLASGTFHSWVSLNAKEESGTVTTNSNVTGGRIQWCRKGNVVTIDMELLELAQWTDGDRQISTSQLPIPLVENIHFSIPPLNSATPSQTFEVDYNGYIKTNGGISNAGQFLGGFSYICKD